MEPSPSKEEVTSAYQLIRRQPPWSSGSMGISHHRVLPFATYAPWLDTPEFLEVWKLIERYTLVDIYRCFELWELAKSCARLEGDFLEVGVWRGGTGTLLCRALKSVGGSQSVYLCDTFSGVVKADPYKDPTYIGGEHADTDLQTVLNLLNVASCHNFHVIEGIFPEQTAVRVENLSGASPKFALCHIDVDVYQSAKDIFDWVSTVLVRGGVVVFDDYGFNGCEGVTKLVNELRVTNGFLHIHNLNGHAIFVKTK